MSDNQKFFHLFNLIPAIGPLRFKKLINHFPNLESAWNASSEELERCGISKDMAAKICASRQKINPEAEWEKFNLISQTQNIQIVTIQDLKYPALLKEIYDPPALLYLRGNLPEAEKTNLAVIGTRKPSQYGQQVVFQMVGLLSQSKIAIISGLALGIDALAHQACLNFNGYTLAVLGGGVDDASIYPRTNFNLAQNILARGGAIISEHPPGTIPMKQNFPFRNRIISGLCRGVLVIEAGEKSGTLITARAALDQNREVFAVPGSIYNPASRGTNFLIKLGAKLTTQTQDIIEELNLKIFGVLESPKIAPENPEEEKIIQNLTPDEPMYIDVLSQKIQIPTPQISTILTMMEMKGMVRNVGGGNYILN